MRKGFSWSGSALAVSLAALAVLFGCAEETGSCVLSSQLLESYCEDGMEQSTCENTDGTIQHDIKIHAKFSSSSCSERGFGATCIWADSDKYKCEGTVPDGTGGSDASGGASSGGSSSSGGSATGGVATGGAKATGGSPATGGTSGACGPENCDGCCDSGTGLCIITDWQNHAVCGANGFACGACSWGVVCDSGACTNEIDPNGSLTIHVDSVMVTATDVVKGTDWDPLGNAPDLYVCVTDGYVQGCTTAGSDSTSHTWPGGYTLADQYGSLTFSSAAIRSGQLRFTVWDQDAAVPDVVADLLLSGITVKSSSYQVPSTGNLVSLIWGFGD